MPTTNVNIGFGLVDVEAKSDTKATATDKQRFTNPQDLALEGVYAPKVATMELDYWKLDGSFKVFPDNPENTTWGFWSNSISGADGTFTVPIVLTLSFVNLHESIGLSFEFNPYDNSYPNNLNIKWYQGDTLLYDVDFIPDNWRYSCMQKVVNYNKIVMTFKSMNKPNRYLKVQNIVHGIYKYFENDEIRDAKILEDVDLTSSELSVNTLDFSVYSEDAQFNIFNPQGVYDLLQKKQQLTVEGKKDKELINFRNYYVDTWSSERNEISISALDAIGIMDGTTFKGGIYNGKRDADLVNEIMTDAGFGYSISVSLADIPVNGCLINVTTEGEVTVSGKKYIENTSVTSVQLPDIEAGEKENIVKTSDAKLITSSNSKATAQRILNYYQKRIE